MPTIYVSSRNKKNNVYLCKPQFYYIKVGFKGVKIILACFRDDTLCVCVCVCVCVCMCMCVCVFSGEGVAYTEGEGRYESDLEEINEVIQVRPHSQITGFPRQRKNR